MALLLGDTITDVCQCEVKEIDPANALLGDILLFGAGKGPAHHCAYVTPSGGLIHCYREAGKVVEHGFSPWWRAKLRHAFRLPGIIDVASDA